MRQLSRQHEVFLLTFIQSEREKQFIVPLREICKEVYTVYLPRWKSLLNCAVAVGSEEPFQVAYFTSVEMKKQLQLFIEQVKPDIIHTHLIRMAGYTADKRRVPRVLDMTDAVSLYLSRFRDAETNPIMKWFLDVEFKRMRNYESIIAKFERGLVCSSSDRDFLLQQSASFKIDLLPNGVDLDAFSTNGQIRSDPFRIIFTGNMSYYPNADGAQFFVREIFPLVKRKIPLAQIYIVGQNPPYRVRSLASGDVFVTGFVDDIRSEYLKSSVAVSPIRFGAGTLNKVLEPLALGIPVVSTSVGVNGLNLKVGEDILVADRPDEFANLIIRLLEDSDYWNGISRTSSSKIRDRFNWVSIAKSLDDVYHQIAIKT